ncbi:MAG: histidine phosphatase family protein [Gammaproteobacteria bacterium]
MTVLYLIRHGQASFGAEDYDRLSERGRRQAALLGEHLSRTRPPFDAVYTGRMRRQSDTASAAGLGGEGEAETLAALDEYDHMSVIRAYLPLFLEKEGGRKGLGPEDLVADHDAFEAAFRFMVRAWMDDTPHQQPGMETWQQFCDRVAGGLDAMVRQSRPGSRIAAVTSGGVVAAALRQVLGLSNSRTLSVNWSIYNASVTQLSYGRGGNRGEAMVLGFNNIAHLELAGDDDLITFR